MEIKQGTKELKTYRVLILCALVILLEGFDIQIAGISAPKLAPVFNLLPSQVGIFLSSSSFGIFISAALGGILADKFGRRPLVVAGVIIFGFFSLSTILATGIVTLVSARFMTGIGLGAAMPAVIAYASDHSPDEMKKRAVGFVYCAIPIGGLLSGVVMQVDMFGTDWQSVYIVGGFAPIVVSPLLFFLLPKSLPVSKNSIESSASQKPLFSGLFGKDLINITASLWIVTFGTLLIMYLLLGWMPSLLVAMGLSKPEAQYVQMLYNCGAAVGAATGGYLLDRKFFYSTPGTAYVALAVFLAIFGFLKLNFNEALLLAFGVGLMVTVAQATIYALSPLCYHSSVRNTGVGATVAAGRLGTIAGPLLAGSLLGAGKTASDVLIVLIPITLISGFIAILVVRMYIKFNNLNHRRMNL